MLFFFVYYFLFILVRNHYLRISALYKLLRFCYTYSCEFCGHGGIGRHASLRGWWTYVLAGSSPVGRTKQPIIRTLPRQIKIVGDGFLFYIFSKLKGQEMSFCILISCPLFIRFSISLIIYQNYYDVWR